MVIKFSPGGGYGNPATQTPIGPQPTQTAPPAQSSQYIDYSQGPYSTGGVQSMFQTMDPRWNTQWQDPNMQGGYQDPSGGSWTLGRTKGLIDKGINDFTQQVQAVTGRAPTADEISNFFQNQLVPMASQAQPGGYNPINPQDITSAIQQYVPTAFAHDIQGYQQTQQSNALNQNIQTGQGLIDQVMGNYSKNLTDPNNPLYQQFAGNMNNLGITPSSGAFQAGLGGNLANHANDLQSQLMGTLGFPSLQGIQGLSGQANRNLQGSAPMAQQNLTTQQNSLGDFGRMQAMAQYLQNQMEPSGFDKNLGRAAGAANALQGVGTGMGAASAATWICTAMVKAGVMTKDEVKELHDHLYKAFWFKPFKFLGYLLFGKFLVYLAQSVNTDWRIWKPAFYQDVMAEPDPIKALNLYEQAFWDLLKVIRERKKVLCSIIQ